MPGPTAVKFHSPSMGATVTPLGFSGDGQVEWDAQGITVTGPVQSKYAPPAVGCLGFIISFVVAIVAIVNLNLDSKGVGPLVAVAFALGATVGSFLLGRKLFPPKQKSVRLSWSQVRNLGREGRYVTFVSKGSPGGQVWLMRGTGASGPGVTTEDRLFHEELVLAGKAGGAAMS